MHPDDRPPTPEDDFNAWLDTFVAGPSTPTKSEPADPELAAAQAAARSAARQVHELAQAAATAHAPSSPVSQSWEEMLMSHTSTASAQPPAAPVPAPRPFVTKPRTHTRRMDTINRIISIAAVLAIFIAGFATAWIARDRFLGENEPPLLQLAASPTSTTTCTTKTLSQEDVDRIVASYKEPTLASYALSDMPVPEADAIAAIATYRAAQSCPFGDPAVDSLRWLRSTESESSLAIRNLARSPSWTTEWLTAYKHILEPLSRMLVPAPASAYVVNTGDSAIKPYVILVTGVGAVVLLPSTFVQFADGRIGAPMLRDVSTYGPVRNLSRITVEFIIFEQIDGHWLVDEVHPLLCPEDCSAAQGLLDQQIASYQRLASAAATPATTPEASPEASPKP